MQLNSAKTRDTQTRSGLSAPVLKGRKRKRKQAVKNSDSDETVESETGSVSVATSSDLASPVKVTARCFLSSLLRMNTFCWKFKNRAV